MAKTAHDDVAPLMRRFPSRRGASAALALVTVAVLAAGCLASGTPPPRPTRASLIGATKPSTSHGHYDLGPASLHIVSVTPRPGASSVPFTTALTVRFSAPLAPGAPTPRLAPAVAGSWVVAERDELVFHPTGNFAPYAKEILTVPAGAAGPMSTRGVHLTKALSSAFTIAGASVLRLQELLAELGYLPLQFTPGAGDPTAAATTAAASTAGPPPGTSTVLAAAPLPAPTPNTEPSVASEIPLRPLGGSFSWRFRNIPPSLQALWTPGVANVITTGAVMRFEMDHGLGTDGVAGPEVWGALLQAVAQRDATTAAYNYVYVAMTSPEYVTLWSDGAVIYQTLANTGIPQSPTQVGTWPVYLRYTVTTMSGTNPNGTRYSDPGIPWVSYFNGGDALHGFIRAQYGFPQSLGCVEMPFSSAQTIYPFTPIGTLVTVL